MCGGARQHSAVQHHVVQQRFPRQAAPTTAATAAPGALKPSGATQAPPPVPISEEFRVAIVGRPNVGKSTLFNRLARSGRRGRGGSTRAIVSPIAGTTRDSRDCVVSFAGMDFTLVDTGGLEDGADAVAAYGAISQHILRKTEEAVASAHLVLFVVDARSGICEADRHFARWLRRRQGRDRTVALLANKAEGGPGGAVDTSLDECLSLGFGEPVAVSALHGDGVGQLAAAVMPAYDAFLAAQAAAAAAAEAVAAAEAAAAAAAGETLPAGRIGEAISATAASPAFAADEQGGTGSPAADMGATTLPLPSAEAVADAAAAAAMTATPAAAARAAAAEAREVRVAIVGRPNVGKSSILNAILGAERSLTGPTPGLTRDAVDARWVFAGRRMRLVDTAGIRKRGKREKGGDAVEELAARDAADAVRMAQVVVLVLDGQEGQFRRTELTIAGMARDEGRAVIIAANKSDLVQAPAGSYAEGVREQVETMLPELGRPPVVPLCALDGTGTRHLLRAVLDAHDRWRRRVTTAYLNTWLNMLEKMHPPPREQPSGRQIRLKYLTQVKHSPPTFALWTNAVALPETYHRFVRKRLQEEFGFHGMPVRILERKAKNVFAERLKSRGGSGGGVGGGGGRTFGGAATALARDRREPGADRRGRPGSAAGAAPVYRGSSRGRGNFVRPTAPANRKGRR